MSRIPVNEPLSGRAAIALFSIPLLAAMGLLTALAYAYVLTDSPVAFGWFVDQSDPYQGAHHMRFAEKDI